ncbi:MAG: hypothetical protein NTV97_23585 [Alphaproteobacteria bacterium]|nr:hypothetical protein [Alphaproteobacteria bacterium]
MILSRLMSGVVAAFLFALASIAVMQPAQSQDVASAWTGYYHYNDGRQPVPFRMTLRFNGNNFRGRVSEPATFGTGASMLSADVVGTITDGKVVFTKTYDGTGGQTHPVQYYGTLSPDGTKISGGWLIETMSGTFIATVAR